MKKIYVVGAQPGGNKGAEAMLEMMLLFLSSLQRDSEFEIYAESLSAGGPYDTFRDRVNIKFNYFLFSAKNIFSPYSVDVSRGDIVIDIGGINYHGKSLRGNVRSLVRHNYFIRKGAKLLFFTQDHGPVKGFISTLIAKYIYSKVDSIFMRSNKSLECLRELGIGSNVEGVFPDSTFLLDKSAVDLPGGDYCIFAPSAIMYNLYGDEYINAFSSLVAILAKKYKPVIICHNFTPNGSSSDLVVCDKLYNAASSCTPILYRREMSPSEYKGLFSGAKLCISSRYHVVVGSFSVGVPAIAIGWNHKYDEFLRLYNQQNLNVSFSGLLVDEVLKEVNLLERNNYLKDDINECNLKQKEKVEKSFELLGLHI